MNADETKLYLDSVAEVERLKVELARWREGGATEQMLRANDGHIRIGKGVSLVRSEKIDSAFAAESTLQGLGWTFNGTKWIAPL